MGGIKAFIVKYKWWIAGFAGALVLLFVVMGRGSSGGGGTVAGTSNQTPTLDPAIALKQLDNQFQLALTGMQIEGKLAGDRLAADVTESGFDLQKYLGNLQASTSTQLATIGSNTSKYVADIGLAAENVRATTTRYEVDASKYIVDRQAQTQEHASNNALWGNVLGGVFGLAGQALGRS